jgi:predicted PurR-regulated permease PerM
VAEPLVEFAPELGAEAEVVVEATPQIGMVAILCVALGMILAAEAICRAFFGTLKGAVGWIPYLGNLVETPIHKIEQKVISFLSGLEHDIDSSMGHHFHQFVHLLEKGLYVLEQTAAGLIILGALGTAAVFHYLIHPLVRWIHGVIRKVEEEIQHIERILQRAGAHVTRVIQHNVIPRLHGAEVTIKRIIEHDVRTIRETARDAEQIAVRAEKNVARLERHLGKKAFLAALTGAIGTLAVEALKCTNLGNLFKKHGCNLWKYLEDLIGLGLSLLALESVCEFLPLIEAAFGAIAGPMVHLLTEVPLGSCEQVPKGWAQLNVAAGPLPPPQTFDPQTL